MFEREVKFIYDFNSNKVKNLGASATFTELLPLGIHPAILQYISAEIEYRIFEDRQTLLKHSMFDYSGPEISKHFHKIADEIKKEKKFSTDFLSKVVLHATSFNVNYLIRPNWSLKKLIFDNTESSSVAEINQILNYAYFYKHLIKVIRNYFEKKKLITLDKDEFIQLLVKFDNVSLQSYGSDILESAIKSTSSFFNIGSMNQKNVPVQAIGVFLQEKNLTSHLEMLQRRIGPENKNKIDVNDLRSILLGVSIERTEIYEVPKKEEEVKLVEKEEVIQPQPVEVPQVEDEDKYKSESSVETVQEEIHDESIDEQIEIKLRSNKEKEIAGVEEEIPEKIEKVSESNKPDQSEEAEAISDYLIDQAEEKVEIILTAEDAEENLEPEDLDDLETSEKHHDNSDEQEYLELVEGIERPEFLIDEDEPNEADTDKFDDEDQELIVEEEKSYDLAPQIDEDYSYPEKEQELTELTEEEEISDDDTENIEDEIELNHESTEDEPKYGSTQTTLFGEIPDSESLNTQPEDEFIKDFGTPNYSKRIDISDLLENRNMTKIIETIFDYDMEEFANAIERICDSSSRQEAFATIQEIFEVNQVNPSSKEAQTFRDIISEYFDQS